MNVHDTLQSHNESKNEMMTAINGMASKLGDRSVQKEALNLQRLSLQKIEEHMADNSKYKMLVLEQKAFVFKKKTFESQQKTFESQVTNLINERKDTLQMIKDYKEYNRETESLFNQIDEINKSLQNTRELQKIYAKKKIEAITLIPHADSKATQENEIVKQQQ